MKIRIYLMAAILIAAINTTAQIQKDNQFNTWIGYSGNHKITNRISVHTLYSWRRNNFIQNWQQSLLRTGINYHVTNNFIVTPGYDWVVTFPYGKQPIAEQNTEHRIFEQFLIKNKVASFTIKHRYRFEQRKFKNTPLKNRFRYRLSIAIPLGNKLAKNRPFSLQLFEEVFLNYGKGVGNHNFDQNWIYAGLAYKINKKAAVKLGYLNQFVPKSDGLRIENNHTLTIGYTYSFDFSN